METVEQKRAPRFNLNRAQVVDENFVAFVRAYEGRSSAPTPGAPGPYSDGGSQRNPLETIDDESGLTGQDLIELFEAQVIARHQDIEARNMRARNEGFYTIGSAGHEGNAVIGRLTRPNDPAFLHYRSGAFMAERARRAAQSGIPAQFRAAGFSPRDRKEHCSTSDIAQAKACGSGLASALDIADPIGGFIEHTMLSFAASREEPIAGGRHKVWGSKKLWVPPQTSTIASHLPKAVGTAMSIARARKLGIDNDVPADAIVVCTFGDASTGHAVAQTAFNAAARARHQKFPVPILFVCEDNGIGISVETPAGWIDANYSNRYGLKYFKANGLDLVDAYRVAKEAIDYCRERRAPVFLHLEVVRLLGHAGSDPETEYHSLEEIERAEAKDPLLASAATLIELGLLTAAEVLDMYERVRARVKAAAAAAAKTAKLTSAPEIMAPLAPFTPDKVAAEAARQGGSGGSPASASDREARIRIFGSEEQLPENGPPRHMAVLINQGLHDLLIKYPESILFGEDVAKKGGVYHVTTGLSGKFGIGRVFNTLLDETTILGLAIGAGHLGLLPVPEIQYLAYYHNAEDQIRGEACSLQFFSKDQFRNPMVIRIAGWAYQKGFGGHFHNDNSIAALRDVPSLIVATPSRGDDAVKMMRTCMAMAKVDGRVIAFIEPIALYMTKDLHAPKDGLWSFRYPPPGETIAFGEGAVYDSHEATEAQSHEEELRITNYELQGVGRAMPADQSRDRQGAGEKSKSRKVEKSKEGTSPNHDIATSPHLTILTFANGVPMSLRAAKTLREEHGIRARVVDLRWLNPLNEQLIIEQALATKRVLVVDEGRRTGGLGEAILAILYENCGSQVKAARVAAMDTYIPLGPAADYVLPQDKDIVAGANKLLNQKIPVT